MSKKIKITAAALLLILSFTLSLLSPFKPFIMNVLTGEMMPHYSVHVPLIRIFFEPFIGILLFYLRADQPLVEFTVLLVWALCVLLLVSMLKTVKKGSILSSSVSGLLRWSAAVPIVFTVWIAVLLGMIFFPLPGNTIVNRDKDTVLVNVHSHTEWSHDGLISQRAMMRWHDRNGFDAFFLTDHNNHDKSLEFVQAQRQGLVPDSPLLICGQEFSGSNHILLLGLERDFNTRGLPDSTVMDSAQANDGVAIVAHWFYDEHKTIQHYIDAGADGYEIVNQGGAHQYDHHIFEQIVEKCQSQGLLLLAACDYHGYGAVTPVWNAFSIKDWFSLTMTERQDAVMDILRRHDQSRITVLVYRDRWIFPPRYVWSSPLFNVFSYFRTLNMWQSISWLLWAGVFIIVSVQRKEQRAGRSRCTFAVAGMAAAFFILLKGVHLLSKRAAVHGYNDIYGEFGMQFLWLGIVLLIYSILYFVWPLVARRRGKRRTAIN